MKKISVAVIGAGVRGTNAYAPYLLENPTLGQVVAVAEPNEEKRNNFKNRYNIKEENTFYSYKDLLSKDKLADALIIATNDEQHYEPAQMALKKGYHILLEKPMSNKLEEVIKLGELAKKYPNQVFMICHILRYTPFFSELKKIVDSKELGQLVSIQHNENIGYYHYAHSYTRGNWRDSNKTSPLVLAKSCHDMDILLWLTGKHCKYISSFGSLSHMIEENFQEDMSDRCVNCIKKEFIYMMEKMNEVRLFSRSLIIHSTIKNKRTAQEYDLLSQLVLHNEGMTPANLSKAMYLNKTIVSRLVDKLNKDGYVTKKQDEYDKRSYSVFITEYGKEELFKIYELYLSPINELRLKLGDEEFFNLISCIEKANKIMNKE